VAGTIVPQSRSEFQAQFWTKGRSVSIQDDPQIRSSASSPGARNGDTDGIANLADDVDQIAVVVDWLDACRHRDLAMLLDLYAGDATLECRCGTVKIREGRSGLASYWRPRLDTPAPTAFSLEEIAPTAEGVVLDYLSHEGKPVRTVFSFTRDGKIQATHCQPAVAVSSVAGLQDYAD
jgi:hypothetical protein